jgi:pyrimidine operon attenuation protein/uracil phosphoribosyltransferase
MALSQNCILNNEEINHKIRRIAYQIYESNVDEKEVVLAGIQSNGYFLAQKIKKKIRRDF